MPDNLTPGYGSTIARCAACLRTLDKAPSCYDGEPTYCGYLPCPAR